MRATLRPRLLRGSCGLAFVMALLSGCAQRSAPGDPGMVFASREVASSTHSVTPSDAATSPGDPIAVPRDPTAPAAAKAATPEPMPRHPFHEPVPGVVNLAGASAPRIANLSPAACRAEFARRELPVERAAGPARGVATPLRIVGPLHGVRFITPGASSPFGVLDCRLVLVLVDFAELLSRHDVVAVRIDNMYRPRARLPNRRNRSQHAYGLAIDILSLELRDGTELVVERDWAGAIGEPVCGPEARVEPLAAPGIALRNLVCDVARAGIFHHLLTPNYDRAHHNHFHFDIKRDSDRGIVQ